MKLDWFRYLGDGSRFLCMRYYEDQHEMQFDLTDEKGSKFVTCNITVENAAEIRTRLTEFIEIERSKQPIKPAS